MEQKLKFLKTKNLKEFLKIHFILKKIFPDLSKKVSLRYLKERLREKEGMFLKAKLKNNLVGFSIWWEEPQNTAYIWWLVVLPEYQKNGFGGMILGETLKEIEKRGIKRVWAKIKNDNFAILSLVSKFHFYIKGLTNEDGLLTVIVEKKLKGKSLSRDFFLEKFQEKSLLVKTKRERR